MYIFMFFKNTSSLCKIKNLSHFNIISFNFNFVLYELQAQKVNGVSRHQLILVCNLTLISFSVKVRQDTLPVLNQSNSII